MALIVSGGLAPTVSGKVGNSVWARNRGGAYIRNFAKPTNPSTPLQAAVRSTFAALVGTWQSLTQTQRDGFTGAAAQVNNPNRVGLTSNPPPLALFQQINVGRAAAGMGIITDAPTMPLTIDWSPDQVLIEEVAGTPTQIRVTFDDTASWCTGGAGNSGLIVYLTRAGYPQTVNFFKGPYNFAGTISGSPATSPGTITLPFTMGPAGNKYFWRAYPSDAQGHLGSVATGSLITT